MDDSQTRIFGKLTEDALKAEDKAEKPEETPEKKPEPKPTDKPVDETIRLDRGAIDAELLRQVERAGGKKRSDMKPMKKKKKGLFGRKRNEDDFFEGEDNYSDTSDDDFIE